MAKKKRKSPARSGKPAKRILASASAGSGAPARSPGASAPLPGIPIQAVTASPAGTPQGRSPRAVLILFCLTLALAALFTALRKPETLRDVSVPAAPPAKTERAVSEKALPAHTPVTPKTGGHTAASLPADAAMPDAALQSKAATAQPDLPAFQAKAPAGQTPAPDSSGLARTTSAHIAPWLPVLSCQAIDWPVDTVSPWALAKRKPESSAAIALNRQPGSLSEAPARILDAPAFEQKREDKEAPKDSKVVLLVGDSLMGWGLGHMLHNTLSAYPGITIKRESRPSTGLSRKDYFDWPTHLAELVRIHNPTLVVVCLGANDAQTIMGDPAQKRYVVGSPSWGDAYQKRAEEFIQVAQANGAKLVWLGLPIVGVEPTGKFLRELSLRQQAACTGHNSTLYIDNYLVLADKNGRYTDFREDKNKKLARIRNKDKIHVTSEGGGLLTNHALPSILKMLDMSAMLKATR